MLIGFRTVRLPMAFLATLAALRPRLKTLIPRIRTVKCSSCFWRSSLYFCPWLRFLCLCLFLCPCHQSRQVGLQVRRGLLCDVHICLRSYPRAQRVVPSRCRLSGRCRGSFRPSLSSPLWSTERGASRTEHQCGARLRPPCHVPPCGSHCLRTRAHNFPWTFLSR